MNQEEARKRIGELLVVGFDGKEVTEEVRELIHTHRIGSVILFARNIGTPLEVLRLTTGLQREAKAAGYERPLLICVDQENGVVRRLGEGTVLFPGAMAQAATGDFEAAHQVSYMTGKELKSLGINWNLAPVLDVNNNPENPVIGVRSYGESPTKVAEFGKRAMRGLQEAGVVSTLKHFPGHGDTDTDSHLDLPVVRHGMDRLEAVELVPFKACIAGGADVVMTAHVYFPELEPEAGRPATLSKNVLTGLLREKLGFEGVITTDCLEMNAIADTIGTAEGAMAALKAGADLVMISHTFSRQIDALDKIMAAFINGDLPESQLEASLERIRKLKDTYLSWDDICLEGEPALPFDFAGEEKAQLAQKLYHKSVTIVKGQELLPLSAEGQSVLVLQPQQGIASLVEDKEYVRQSLGAAVREHVPKAEITVAPTDFSEAAAVELLERARAFDVVIVGTLMVTRESPLMTLVRQLTESGPRVVLVAMRSPYALAFAQDVAVAINTYEFSPPALAVAAGALFGAVKPSGKLPITLVKEGVGRK